MAPLMTESLLRTRTHITLYLLGAVIMAALSFQNVRYGFYNLFYVSALFIPMMLAGAMYGWSKRNENNAQQGHLIILVSMTLIVGFVVLEVDEEAHHWAYVIGLFSFLLVPLRLAIYVNLLTAIWVGAALTGQSGLYSGIRFLASYALLSGLAGMYAHLYHHKSRSLVALSIKDSLTGAYNLRHLDYTLKQEISRSESSGHPLSLIALEIDYYAQQLDVHGQGVGNELLGELTKLLRTMTRAGDSVYYGGDGLFYLMLPFTPQEGVLVIAERIRRTVEDQAWPVVDKMTVSLGCVTRGAEPIEDQALLEASHRALRDAQTSGHNKVCHDNRKR